jgi:ubiquinol-cytochrome c reductase cytochrome b subunit
MGWLEGALRLTPGWRVHLFGHTISELFWPAIVLPGLTFGLLYLWPFLEARVTGDHEAHHLLDRPRDRPVRTAIGVGVLTFYLVLFVAGSQDIVAQTLGVSIPAVTWAFRLLLVVLPLLTASIAWRVAHDLSAGDEPADEEPPSPQVQPDPAPEAPAPKRETKVAASG